MTLALVLALSAAVSTPSGGTEILDVEAVQHDDNILRADIVATTDEPARLRVRWWNQAESHTSACGEEGTSHSIPVWGLRPSQSYRFNLGECGGPARSDILRLDVPAWPDDQPTLTIDHPCSGCSVENVLLEALGRDLSQDLFVIDVAGDFVWYQVVGGVGPASLLEDGSGVVYVRSTNEIFRRGFDGALRSHFTKIGSGAGGDEVLQPDRCYHHEIFEQDGLIHTVYSTPFDYDDGEIVWPYMDDGVEMLALDGSSVFDLPDILQGVAAALDIEPSETGNENPITFFSACGFDDRIHWGHGNSLQALDDGSFLLNFRNWGEQRQGQAILIDAVGSPLWVLGKRGDFSFTPGVRWFRAAHHANVTAFDEADRPQTVLLYDNSGAGTTARVLELGLSYDELGAPAAAEILREVGLGERCSIKGSVYQLADGHLLTMCSDSGRIVELDWDFEAGVSTPYWQATIGLPLDSQCPGCANYGLYRVEPVGSIVSQ